MADKIYLDDEMKKALLGLAPYSPEVPFDFTPKHYQDRGLADELIPIYSLRTLTKGEQETIAAEFRRENSDGGKLYEITRKAVKGWKNVIDIGFMEAVPYKSAADGGADDSVFQRISKNDREAIFSHILAVSGLVRADRLGFGF